MATDLTFRLKGQVSADELVGLMLRPEGSVPFCLRCVVRANPEAFPGLPSEPVAFDRGASSPKGIELRFGEYAGCEGAIHRY